MELLFTTLLRTGPAFFLLVLILPVLMWLVSGCAPDDPLEAPSATPDTTETPAAPTSTPCPSPTSTPTPLLSCDSDEDGFPARASCGSGVGSLDCNDLDPEVHPEATEIPYDGVDQDCDGSDLDDVDRDGYSAEAAGGTDCNDEDPGIKPGTVEIAYDGIDQDCDGGDLVDADFDGYAGGPDCDDGNPDVYPGAPETAYDGLDQDCDGADLTDVDGDGYDAIVAGGTDCDDTDPGVAPDQAEIPYDGIDQDCSGADLVDLDGDGFPSLQVEGGTDCDDEAPDVHPGALEVQCQDGVDQNCDGNDSCLGDYPLTVTPVQLVGEAAYDQAGYPLVSVGDIDRDGLSDVLVGAYGNDDGGTDAGKVYLLLGPLTHEALSEAEVQFVGEEPYGRAGLGLAAGDLDGDSCSDLVIGAPAVSPTAAVRDYEKGCIYVFYTDCQKGVVPFASKVSLAEADLVLTGADAGDSLGREVAVIGDVNADGYEDLLASSFVHGDNQLREAGEVYLLYGGPKKRSLKRGEIEDVADASFAGEHVEDWVGNTLSRAGDINGDGIDDFLVGAMGDDEGGSDAGKVHVFLGHREDPWAGPLGISSSSFSIVGERSDAMFGHSIAWLGDINNDGYDDFFVGAPYDDLCGEQCGRAYIFLGGAGWNGLGESIDASMADYTIAGPFSHANFGSSAAYAGDLNGDGIDDFAIGSGHYGDQGDRGPGKVFLFFGWADKNLAPEHGALSLDTADAVYSGEGEYQMVGESLAAAGDTSGDGSDDLLVGACWWGDQYDEWVGKVYLLPGETSATAP